jgi:DNA-binding NarL/FixJ family response regulator
MSVLVVDDDNAILETIREVLSRSEFRRVLCVLNASELNRYLKKVSSGVESAPAFSLLGMNIGADREAGLKMLRQIRRDLPGVPAVIMSHSLDSRIIAESFRSGAASYIEKSRPDFFKKQISQTCKFFSTIPSYNSADAMSDPRGARRSTKSKKYCSVFISYGGPDEDFAASLYYELNKRGVNVSFFKEHATGGQKLHRLMRENININDRVVLICSKSSLNRPGVLNELEEALAREAREGGASILIPISIDNYLFRGWLPKPPELAKAIRDRVVVDFKGAMNDRRIFKKATSRLLKALER